MSDPSLRLVTWSSRFPDAPKTSNPIKKTKKVSRPYQRPKKIEKSSSRRKADPEMQSKKRKPTVEYQNAKVLQQRMQNLLTEYQCKKLMIELVFLEKMIDKKFDNETAKKMKTYMKELQNEMKKLEDEKIVLDIHKLANIIRYERAIESLNEEENDRLARYENVCWKIRNLIDDVKSSLPFSHGAAISLAFYTNVLEKRNLKRSVGPLQMTHQNFQPDVENQQNLMLPPTPKRIENGFDVPAHVSPKPTCGALSMAQPSLPASVPHQHNQVVVAPPPIRISLHPAGMNSEVSGVAQQSNFANLNEFSDEPDIVFVGIVPCKSQSSSLPIEELKFVQNMATPLFFLEAKIADLPLIDGVPKLSLNMQDLFTLRQEKWLNDNLVNFSLQLALIDADTPNQIHILDSLFFKSLVTVKETKRMSWFTSEHLVLLEKTQLQRNAESVYSFICNKQSTVDIFQKKIVILPVCQGGHWMMIAVVNPFGAIVDENGESSTESPCRIFYFDSLYTDRLRENHFRNVTTLWLASVWERQKPSGTTKRFSAERIRFERPINIPRQNNTSDCGIFVIHYCQGILAKFQDIVKLPATERLDWDNVDPNANSILQHKPRHEVIRRILKSAPSEVRLAVYRQWTFLGFGEQDES